MWIELPEGYDAEAVLPRAIERGVAFVPGRYFYAGEPRRETLRVSFATATPAELRRRRRPTRRRDRGVGVSYDRSAPDQTWTVSATR